MHLHIYIPMLLNLFGTSGSNQVDGKSLLLLVDRITSHPGCKASFLSEHVHLILSVLTSCVSFRSFAPRGTNHSSQHHQPHNVLHPTPPLLPLPRPPFCPPVGGPASNRRYQWGPPEPDSHWRRPPRSEDSRHRYPPAEPDWPPYARRQEDRRRGPPPPRNRYSPRWTNESSGHDAPQRMWTGPRARHNHRVDTMDNYWTQGN